VPSCWGKLWISSLDDPGQLVEALGEEGARVGRWLRERGREAPDLPAVLLREIAEGLDEAREEVGLGEDHVDRERHLEAALHLVDPLAHAASEGTDLFLLGATDLIEADGREDAVEGLARAEAPQEVEEAHPLVAILVLGGPAAGRVEQHRLVGQPPVAVARPADAADAAAGRRHVRELKPRVPQRGRLAAAGRPDDHVPRQGVERVLAAPRDTGALQRGDGALELLLHLQHLAGHVRASEPRLLGRLRCERLLELTGGAPRAETPRDDDREQDEDGAGRHEHGRPPERPRVGQEQHEGSPREEHDEER